LVKHDWSGAGNPLADSFLVLEKLIHHLVVRLRLGNLPRRVRQRVLSEELDNLLSVTPAEALSCTELVRDFRIVCSIVHWQLSEDTVAKVDIYDFVVLTGRE